MKTVKLFMVMFFATITTMLLAQPSVKSETVKVWGNCDMCQSKIEKAAKKAGATAAKWDEESKMLTVSFNSKKTNMAVIEKAVAKVGYDTQNETATDEAYNQLPGCCQYDRKPVVQKDSMPN